LIFFNLQKRFYFVMLPMVIAMKGLRSYKQFLITAPLVTLLSLIGGCSPKVLVPPEQRAHLRGTFGGSIFAG